MPLFVSLTGISAWLSTTSSVLPSVTSGSNLGSAFQALLCCLEPLSCVGHLAEPGTWARLHSEAGSLCHASHSLGLPTLSGLQRSLSSSLARSWVAFPALCCSCSKMGPQLWAKLGGKGVEENRHFLPTLLALRALFLSSSGQKASNEPSVLGAALGSTPQSKEEPLHQQTLHHGQPFHALAPFYPGRLWLLDMSVVVSSWWRSWGNLTPS